MKNFIISEDMLKDVLNVIAHATHTSVSFAQISGLVNTLQQLPEHKIVDAESPTTQC